MHLRTLALTLALSAFPLAASAQPACFTTPLPSAASARAESTEPDCQILARLLAATVGAADIEWIPGQIVNARLNLKEGGFAADTFVLEFRATPAFSAAFTNGRDELVRLSSSDLAARTGSWWVPKELVTDSSGHFLSLETIKELLALPQDANLKIAAYSGNIGTGTLVYAGVVAPAFQHQGGGFQFWFPSEPVYSKASEPLRQ